MYDIDDGLNFISILLQQNSFEFRKILLTLQPADSFLLIISDTIHFLPNLIFLASELWLFSLFVKLAEVLVDTAIEWFILDVLILAEVWEKNRAKIF